MLLLIPLSGLHAADSPKRQQLQRDIRQLSSTLSTQKDESDTLTDEVTALEKKLGETSRLADQTEKKIEATSARLQDTNTQKLTLDTELDAQKRGLAQQLQALYAAGEQSHLRLLLRQDQPSDISRTLRYFEYLNADRVANIQKIGKTIKQVNVLRASMDTDKLSLQNLTQTLTQQKADIERTLNTRSDALKKLDGDIHSKENHLNQLQQQNAALQDVVDNLSRQPEDTDEQAQTAHQPERAAALPLRQHSAPDKGIAVSTHATSNQVFSSLRGRLSWPVAGKITHTYNSARNEKQKWQGVVISAPGGTKVRAVARGRVAFSGWLNGYGHLIIIEHDNRYMSLYGYNRAVYKQKGETVNANEAIASVGNSSGQPQDGLYFEIRQGTAPQNPARWCH